MINSVFIGFDKREAAAFAVARHSLRRRLPARLAIGGLILAELQAAGLYRRPIKMLPGVDRPIMWDEISDAPMSTEHACARFLVRELARQHGCFGWAMFCDADVLFRNEVGPLFASLDRKFALYCVKHPPLAGVAQKMDGQVQTTYARKNWSSVFLLNVAHPANDALTLDMINSVPGRDLHRFCWLDDDQIGELDPGWNFLVGVSDPAIAPVRLAHFTLGTPDMRGYEQCAYADEWRAELAAWARR